MAGRSGIGVLVTGFSRVGALKKHAPLVFNFFQFLPEETGRKWKKLEEIHVSNGARKQSVGKKFPDTVK